VSERWRIASLDEIELPQLPNAARWAGVRRHFGIESFGVNAWRAAEAGADVIAEHDEVSGTAAGHHEELYVVLEGRATFTVAGESFEATPGAVVLVHDPAAKRQATAEEAGTRILALGAPRGTPFRPSNWERSAPAFGHFATGDYEAARAMLEQAHAEWPDDATVLYNLACAESGSGRAAEAVEHLRRAIELDASDRFRDLARGDSDFDPIRDEAVFKDLVS
jgi:tetratricopeptide (TPR) repeat protein